MCGLLRFAVIGLIAGSLSAAGLPSRIRAADFEMTIEIRSGGKPLRTQRTLRTLKHPLSTKPAARPVLTVTRGKIIPVRWQVTRTNRQTAVKNVFVHFFVVREQKVGQTKVPNLGKDVEQEGALTMDFKPSDTASGKFTLSDLKPGSYLMRIETIGLAARGETDYYAACDLVVK